MGVDGWKLAAVARRKPGEGCRTAKRQQQTAVEAVKIACRRDVYSGGRVRSFSVKP